ncbi:hypothetical protein FLAV_02174 [Flavobacteriales bacterium]|nr:hypothetical protein FLAV_02174 [Flavobacteriales bacterium]
MKKAILTTVILTCFMNFSFGQVGQLPQPVDLGIQNITQQTSSWCWAATAQQVIYWLKGNAPPQCQLVANAFNANVQYCCTYPQACNSPGYMQQIQGLILAYGGHYSSISPPANEMAVYQTLSQGKAIVLFLQTTPYVGHFVVLRGMAWVPTQFGYQSVLYINDPMSYFTQPVSFNQLLTIWRAAIVVY